LPAAIFKFEDAAATFKRDTRALNMAVAGVTVREIAEHEECSIDEVECSLVRMTGAASPQLRERYLQLAIERLDKMVRAFYPKAMGGDYDSAVIVIRSVDTQCRLLGLFPPPQSSHLEKRGPKISSTEDIRAALDAVMGKTGQTIDGDVVKDGGDE
jgi:hypothetical protein